MFIGGEHASDRHALPSKAERGLCTEERPVELRVSCFRSCSAFYIRGFERMKKLRMTIGGDAWQETVELIYVQWCFCSKDIHAHSTPRSIQ